MKCENCGEEHLLVSDAWMRTAARDLYQKDGEIEIDDHAIVSRGDDCGAYVAAWVWVSYPILVGKPGTGKTTGD